MKKKYYITPIFTLSLLLSVLVGCKKSTAETTKTLSVTIEPQAYFLKVLAGDNFNINCVVPSGSNPESADFSPSQMISLDKSIAYFKIGYLGIENALIKKVSPDNPNLQIIDCSEGITLIGEACVHEHDEHDHDHDIHGHSAGDPHIWSSVTTAKIIAQNMYNGLVKLDSVNMETYTANLTNLLSEINQTDSIIKGYINKAPSKSFIIYHPALSYFAEEYGLTQYSIEHEGKNPSPSQLKELIDKAKEESVKVVFVQQEFDTKNAETIAKAIGAKTIPVNLLSFEWSNEMIKIAKALASEE